MPFVGLREGSWGFEDGGGVLEYGLWLGAFVFGLFALPIAGRRGESGWIFERRRRFNSAAKLAIYGLLQSLRYTREF